MSHKIISMPLTTLLVPIVLLVGCTIKQPNCEYNRDYDMYGQRYELHYCGSDITQEGVFCFDDGSPIFECYKLKKEKE